MFQSRAANEISWFVSNFNDQVTVSDDLSAGGLVEANATALLPNALIHGNSIEYIVTAFNSQGLMSISDDLSITDTVPPTSGAGFTTGLVQAVGTSTQTLYYQASEPVGSATASPNGIADADVTATIDTANSDFEEGLIAIYVNVPGATDSIAANEFITLSFTDTCGNTADGNLGTTTVDPITSIAP